MHAVLAAAAALPEAAALWGLLPVRAPGVTIAN